MRGSRLLLAVCALAALLLPAGGSAAAASPSARTARHHHRARAHRHRRLRVPRGRVPAGHPGMVTVRSASATTAVVTGLPFDWNLFTVSIPGSRALTVNTTSGTILAAVALCSQRAGCGTVSGSDQYVPAKPSLIRAGDQLLLELNASADTAGTAARRHTAVDNSLAYDFGS